jgi:adenylate kinase family enzyme
MTNQIFFVLGGPGSGKGTICQNLKNILGFEHISLGDVIREFMTKNPEHPKTLMYKSTLNDGVCIPASESIHFLLDATDNMYQNKTNKKIVIDGYPRSIEQLQSFLTAMNTSFDKLDIKLIYVDTPVEVMINRMTNRARDFRDGDISIMRKRINYYTNETLAVIDYFSKYDKVIYMNGLDSLEINIEKIRKEINK